MPKIQNVIYFLPNNREKNYFYIELTRLNMDDFFTLEEKKELFSLYRHLLQSAGDSISWKDCLKLKRHLIKAAQCNGLQRNNFGMNPVIRDLQTAVIVAEEIGMKGSCLIGIMLHEIVKAHILSIEEVNAEYGEEWEVSSKAW